MDLGEQSLELHKRHRGKLGVASKVAINTKEELSLAYTPGVGRVSEEVAKNPELAWSHTMKGNTVAVISDGSAVLGLGNLGALGALPVMEGKAIIFKEFAGIDAFPICLDTQDVDEIVETVKRIAPVFGGINLEDISAPRCFEIEARLKAELKLPVFHDDQHGTAIVVLAGLINALKLRGTDKGEVRVVINGAGAAGISIALLLTKYGFKNLVLCDSQGIVSQERTDLTEIKLQLARQTNPEQRTGQLQEALVGADIFIGVSKASLLTEGMVESMAKNPIIFALANPVPEIMPDVAKRAGAYIIATGRSDFPNQVNNALVFPGIFKAALSRRLTRLTEESFICAAETLAGYVQDPTVDAILPSPLDKGVVEAIAQATCMVGDE